MTRLAKALGGKKCFDSQSRMHGRTHAHSNPKIIHTKVARAPAEITEPCPISGLPLFKKAGRGKKRKRGKTGRGRRRKGRKWMRKVVRWDKHGPKQKTKITSKWEKV